MGWLGLLNAVLSLASLIAKYLSNNQLIAAGEAKAMNRNLSRALKNIAKARAARRSVATDPDVMSDDGFKRD